MLILPCLIYSMKDFSSLSAHPKWCTTEAEELSTQRRNRPVTSFFTLHVLREAARMSECVCQGLACVRYHHVSGSWGDTLFTFGNMTTCSPSIPVLLALHSCHIHIHLADTTHMNAACNHIFSPFKEAPCTLFQFTVWLTGVDASGPGVWERIYLRDTHLLPVKALKCLQFILSVLLPIQHIFLSHSPSEWSHISVISSNSLQVVCEIADNMQWEYYATCFIKIECLIQRVACIYQLFWKAMFITVFLFFCFFTFIIVCQLFDIYQLILNT